MQLQRSKRRCGNAANRQDTIRQQGACAAPCHPPLSSSLSSAPCAFRQVQMLRYQLHAHAVHAHEGLGRLQERRFGHGTVWRSKRSTEKSRFRPSDGCRGPKGRGSRCEAARAAIRFGGQVREDVLKCTIAPGFCPKGGPEVGLISLFFLSLSLPPPSSPSRSPHHCGATQGAWL